MTEPTNPTTEATKAGRRHSASDMADIQTLHEIAKRQGAVCDADNVPQADMPMKAGALPETAPAPEIWGTVKAAGDWELDVLGLPYGGPHDGKDAHGEYFDARTQTHDDKFGLPPAVYYHGYGDNGLPMGDPAYIGRTVKRWRDSAGVWFRVVLDRASALAAKVWAAAQAGKARASSGTVAHLRRVEASGHITHWPVAELSVFDTDNGKQPANAYAVAIPALKSVYQRAGLTLPDFHDSEAKPETDTTGASGPVAVARSGAVRGTDFTAIGATTMNTDEMAAAAQAQIDAEESARKAAEAAELEKFTAAYRAGQAKARAEAAEQMKALKAEAVAAGRLQMGTPDAPGQAPAQTQFHNTRKFDGLSADDMGFMLTLLSTMKKKDPQHEGYSPDAFLAYTLKVAEDKTLVTRRDGRTQIPLGDQGRAALKAVGIDPNAVLNGAVKANELNHSTQASFGDDWVGVEYSNRLWEQIRFGTFVLDKMPSVEVPQGAESIVISLESGDPTWYKVAQTTAEDSTDKRPVASVPSSKMGTANKTLTVAKIGARTQFSGELVEDSIIPWVAQLRQQMAVSGAQMLEHIIIDGDTEAGNAANVNDIDGTPAATDLFLTLDGFRKSALVTTTSNSRSASGSLTDTDYLATVKLMGTGGLNAMDKEKVEFIVDVNTYWKSLELASLKTRDVFTAATLENGDLASIWGYKVRRSGFMHFESAKRMAETTGKIDQTDSDNTTGAILAVRYDQFLFGYKRRFQIKLQEMIDSDSTQIVAFARVGMVQRDTEGVAITYNVGV
jgi:hypothetical protein